MKASASTVYTKEELYNSHMIYDNALNNKAAKSDTYLKTEIDSRCSTSNLLIHTKVSSSSVDLGSIFRLVNL